MSQKRGPLAQFIARDTLKKGVSRAQAKAVAAYLLSTNLVNQLQPLMRDVQADWAELGYVEVLAESAFPLSAEVKTDIVKQLKPLFPKARQIKVTDQLSPELIGSIKLTLADQQVDYSVISKLNKFKTKAMEGVT